VLEESLRLNFLSTISVKGEGERETHVSIYLHQDLSKRGLQSLSRVSGGLAKERWSHEEIGVSGPALALSPREEE
jgi:hypothetical protein